MTMPGSSIMFRNTTISWNASVIHMRMMEGAAVGVSQWPLFPSYGILTMQFGRDGEWYQVVRIMGPTHNLFALKPGELDAPEPIDRCSRPQSPRCGLPVSSASARNSR